MPDEVVKFDKKSGSSILAAMKRDPERVGEVLVKLATKSADHDFTQAVVDRVKELVKHRQALELALQKTQNEIALFDARLAAIEEGKFKIDLAGTITYTDPFLNFGYRP